MSERSIKTATARAAEAAAVKDRLWKKIEKPLGLPKKKFSETFKAVELLVKTFSVSDKYTKRPNGDHE